jgi:hypothetical protein
MNQTAEDIEEKIELKADSEDDVSGPSDARDTSARSEREKAQKPWTEHVPKIPKYLVGGGCSGGGLH